VELKHGKFISNTRRDQWRSKVGAGPCARIPPTAMGPHETHAFRTILLYYATGDD